MHVEGEEEVVGAGLRDESSGGVEEGGDYGRGAGPGAVDRGEVVGEQLLGAAQHVGADEDVEKEAEGIQCEEDI